MKDGYSFDRDAAGARASYQAMYDAYGRVFARMGLKFRQWRLTPARSAARQVTSFR